MLILFFEVYCDWRNKKAQRKKNPKHKNRRLIKIECRKNVINLKCEMRSDDFFTSTIRKSISRMLWTTENFWFSSLRFLHAIFHHHHHHRMTNGQLFGWAAAEAGRMVKNFIWFWVFWNGMCSGAAKSQPISEILKYYFVFIERSFSDRGIEFTSITIGYR